MKKGSMILGIFVALGLAPTSRAGMLLTPNGDPTGAAVAIGSNGGTAALSPVMAFETSQPQVGPGSDDNLLVAALNAQGFNAGSGYTFTYKAFVGNDFTLGTYLAWADSMPQVNQGTLTVGANPMNPLPGRAGCNIGIGYAQNNAADPATVRWISIIEDNNPTTFEKTNGVADPIRAGFTLSVDNPFAPQVMGKPTVPFYDAGGAANGNGFIDAPFDQLSSNTQLIFHTFAVTAVGNALTIYDDITWGVLISVPEPGSFVMVAIGGGTVAIAVRRKRRRAA